MTFIFDLLKIIAQIHAQIYFYLSRQWVLFPLLGVTRIIFLIQLVLQWADRKMYSARTINWRLWYFSYEITINKLSKQFHKQDLALFLSMFLFFIFLEIFSIYLWNEFQYIYETNFNISMKRISIYLWKEFQYIYEKKFNISIKRILI